MQPDGSGIGATASAAHVAADLHSGDEGHVLFSALFGQKVSQKLPQAVLPS
jgi:hypothetical protein